MLVGKLHPGVEHFPLLKFDFALFFHAPQNCHSQRILAAYFQRLPLCTCVFILFDSLFSPFYLLPAQEPSDCKVLFFAMQFAAQVALVMQFHVSDN